MSDLLDRNNILVAFDKLNSELARRRAEVDLFVVGGAAIILTYDTDRRTRDGDAVFTDTGVVYEASRTVARRMHLPNDWLNDAVRTYTLGIDKDASVIYEQKSLRVTVGSPAYVLVMKLLAARLDRDEKDIEFLCKKCGVSTKEDGINIIQRYLPDQQIPDKTIDILDIIFPPEPDYPHRRR